ncbi:FCD domain-containing protein [Streptomyces hydrogenans]|uniref:FCD domain-containing protein n=1 Tax=Streptomyces hydrogenans TaxID=1873719 RepID=UPI0034420BE6
MPCRAGDVSPASGSEGWRVFTEAIIVTGPTGWSEAACRGHFRSRGRATSGVRPHLRGARASVDRVQEHAVEAADPVAFVHANWRLHAAIAAISPNALLSSLYTHLLDLIESHTLTVLPTDEQPLSEYVAHRHELHRDLVDALDRRDRDEALRLIHEHNTGLRAAGDHAAEH